MKKINFFKKIWYSITKFEKYPEMALEGVKEAIKYLMILTVILTLFISTRSFKKSKETIQDLSNYIQENIPEFSYENGQLSMEMEDTIIIDNIEDEDISRVVINTIHENEEQKEQIKEDNLKEGEITVIFFKDEVILETKDSENQTSSQKYTYSNFIASYTSENIEKFNKEEFIQILSSKAMYSYYFNYALTTFIALYIVNVICVLIYSLEIAILGWITALVTRIKIKWSAIYSMSIYSLTLSTILYIIYAIINYFTDFKITYFQFAYIAIAYIYLVAVIFILKDDIIRKMQEVEQIKKEQENVRREIKEEKTKTKEEKKEKKEKKKSKEKDENKDEGEEPQGSEV